MAKKFYELDIWKKGHELLMKIYEVTAHFPSEERFSLISQILRSAIGIIANIAEAHGRFYYADKVRILYIARYNPNKLLVVDVDKRSRVYD